MLERILAETRVISDPNILVGIETADDAGVYLLNDEQGIVQTVDFFTPVVDDAFVYGQIAAANALSDVYAMGAEALFALSVIGFPPDRVEESELIAIVRGGTEKMKEAGVPVIGGHSIQDQEIKFGYSVTGVVPPQKIWRNSGARPGDVLVLTKPLGIGIVSTGIKFGKTPGEVASAAIETMLQLNRTASQAMRSYEIHAVTDVTGYGLVGHACEMARASDVTLMLEEDRIPVLEGAAKLASKGMLPGGIESNRRYVADWVCWDGISESRQQLLLDPQTSGGLLVSLPDDRRVGVLLDSLHAEGVKAVRIGRVAARETKQIRFV